MESLSLSLSLSEVLTLCDRLSLGSSCHVLSSLSLSLFLPVSHSLPSQSFDYNELDNVMCSLRM